MRLKLSIAIAAASLALAGPGHAAVSLLGSTVYATLNYPTLTTVYSGATAVVGASGLTFPAGTIVGSTPFSINITSNQIFYYPGANATYSSLPNGFAFNFTGNFKIVGVSLDSSSTYIPNGFTFANNAITLIETGDTVTQNSVAILNVDVAAVPEMATWVMMIGGFGLVGATMRQKASTLALSTNR